MFISTVAKMLSKIPKLTPMVRFPNRTRLAKKAEKLYNFLKLSACDISEKTSTSVNENRNQKRKPNRPEKIDLHIKNGFDKLKLC